MNLLQHKQCDFTNTQGAKDTRILLPLGEDPMYSAAGLLQVSAHSAGRNPAKPLTIPRHTLPMV